MIVICLDYLHLLVDTVYLATVPMFCVAFCHVL